MGLIDGIDGAFRELLRQPASIRYHPLDRVVVQATTTKPSAPMLEDSRVIPGFLELTDGRGRVLWFHPLYPDPKE